MKRLRFEAHKLYGGVSLSLVTYWSRDIILIDIEFLKWRVGMEVYLGPV
jgi:hypothetical protein